jgi:polyhydroxybutyrate depolymerase
MVQCSKIIWRLIGIVVLIACQFSIGCTPTLLQVNRLVGPKTYQGAVDIRLNGFRRTYLVHIPPGYRPEISLPLVVVIHGAFDTAEGMEKFSKFSRLADSENFIVMYPNGFGVMGFLQHWNAGHCCGKAAGDKLEDVGFVAAAIEDVAVRLKIDRDRIYMVGFSNGGMLVYRFAAERGGLLAAVAPLAASIGGRPAEDASEWRIPEPEKPLSVITIHGLADDDVPYEGGVSSRRGGTRTYWSVEDSVDFWVNRNGCAPQPVTQTMRSESVLIKSWENCKNETTVALWLIKGWGHVWPGKYFTTDLAEDDPLKNFDAAEIIWDFFKSRRQ